MLSTEQYHFQWLWMTADSDWESDNGNVRLSNYIAKDVTQPDYTSMLLLEYGVKLIATRKPFSALGCYWKYSAFCVNGNTEMCQFTKSSLQLGQHGLVWYSFTTLVLVDNLRLLTDLLHIHTQHSQHSTAICCLPCLPVSRIRNMFHSGQVHITPTIRAWQMCCNWGGGRPLALNNFIKYTRWL